MKTPLGLYGVNAKAAYSRGLYEGLNIHRLLLAVRYVAGTHKQTNVKEMHSLLALQICTIFAFYTMYKIKRTSCFKVYQIQMLRAFVKG